MTNPTTDDQAGAGFNFFEKPILNSPYAYPKQHWELDDTGQPTNRIIANRRIAEFIMPIRKAKKQKGQKSLGLDSRAIEAASSVPICRTEDRVLRAALSKAAIDSFWGAGVPTPTK